VMTSITNRKRILQIMAAVVGAILLWQLAAMLIDKKILLASPLDVFIRLTTIWTEEGFFMTLSFSFLRIVGGFFAALILGIVLGTLAGKFSLLEIILMPYMVTIKSVPVASFVIISLIWLNSRELPIFISFLMVLPIVYTNILNGIKSVDRQKLEMAKVFQLSPAEKLRFIFLPHLKPFLYSALSVSLGLAWKSGVAAEVIGIPDGSLGERLYMAKVHFETVDLFAWTLIIVFISVGFEKLFMYLVKLVMKKSESL